MADDVSAASPRRPSPQTLPRNWDEHLQEIRVTQTGVQILTGFLLTVPFSNRFSELTRFRLGLYIAVLGGAVTTTGLVLALVAFHRVLFRHRRRELLVTSANRFALGRLATLALTVSGVVLLVVDIVLGTVPALVSGLGVLIVLTMLWAALPRMADRADDSPPNAPPPADNVSGP